ncbi:hypothetical protein PVA44_07440 (plasmid) [Entomospira nematocerorum]|uniref:Uncharacterized protein n=1 Tax=Entomospira nematocerorum TaxID=2719987 RepID=A0A968GDF2_9SPIO|nr:hypothetical protein [Entomospira nematocera]NIZ47744.1 hypothetical protein [Entomospira nematocera]WDI34699.1 hypothetical protein PVA44_07440 [Entomospira nematocera]
MINNVNQKSGDYSNNATRDINITNNYYNTNDHGSEQNQKNEAQYIHIIRYIINMEITPIVNGSVAIVERATVDEKMTHNNIKDASLIKYIDDYPTTVMVVEQAIADVLDEPKKEFSGEARFLKNIRDLWEKRACSEVTDKTSGDELWMFCYNVLFNDLKAKFTNFSLESAIHEVLCYAFTKCQFLENPNAV